MGESNGHVREYIDGPLDGLFTMKSSSNYVVWVFLSHSTQWRKISSEERKQYALKQLSGMFGSGANKPIETIEFDWQKVKYTCSETNLTKTVDPWDHPRPKSDTTIWIDGIWGRGKLLAIGSETDTGYGGSPGFLEGAVRAAE